MARGDGIDRTNARNMRLTETKIGNTQQHNEREKDSYVNQDIVLERTLPEAGPLESAKSYREKKAKPLWEKIVKVLRSVYRAYFDLKSKFERLQSAYDREVSKNGSLSARIYEVCAERDGLKGQVRDYERVRRAIGPEQADRILEAAYQQEQVEKEQKWGARSKIRVGAR